MGDDDAVEVVARQRAGLQEAKDVQFFVHRYPHSRRGLPWWLPFARYLGRRTCATIFRPDQSLSKDRSKVNTDFGRGLSAKRRRPRGRGSIIAPRARLPAQ